MPKKIKATPEEFSRFDQAMLELGYMRLSSEEIERDRIRLGLQSRRRKRQEGKEVGYYFSQLDYKVKVWTTWIEEEAVFRQEDQGWILIARGDRALHFEHPFNRTKNFLRRLYNYARVDQERLNRRPQCQHCKTPMQLVEGDRLKERGWACINVQNHPEQTYEVVGFNAMLDSVAMKYLERYEKRSNVYRAKREEEGKPNFVAMLRHKGWIVTRPENIEW